MFHTLKHAKIVVLMSFLSFVFLIDANALDNLIQNSIEPNKIEIIAGKSLVMKLSIPVRKKLRVSIGSPDIADCLVLSGNEIYVNGKTAGITNLILWQEDKLVAIYDVEVKFDVSRLKEKLHQILPDEKELMVTATNNSISLTGKVSNAANLAQALSISNAYAPEGKVNNLLTVGGTHQVMLEVKIAEMSRSLSRDLGIDLGVFKSGTMAIDILSGFGSNIDPLAPAFDAFLQYTGGDTTWAMLINALKENGLVKVLAEPNLIALSGKTASFLAGGEYPIPVPDEDGITIEYKDFGVGLSFTPNVLSKDKINIQVNSSVSDLDFTTAVQFRGYVVPGISIRRASTTVELADGQSFVIAGLLSESIRENAQKFPFLGDLPFLGTLFKSNSFLKNKTELVILVTPRFVKPIDKKDQPVPTDYYDEPDDVEFYFNIDRSAKKSAANDSDVKMDGQFGHSFED
jgi:pilus assembly protein CpaC